MDDTALEGGQGIKHGFLTSLLDLIGNAGGQFGQRFFTSMAIVVSVKGRANPVACLLVRNDVKNVLEGIQNFSMFADQKGHVSAIQLDVHVSTVCARNLRGYLEVSYFQNLFQQPMNPSRIFLGSVEPRRTAAIFGRIGSVRGFDLCNSRYRLLRLRFWLFDRGRLRFRSNGCGFRRLTLNSARMRTVAFPKSPLCSSITVTLSLSAGAPNSRAAMAVAS